MQSNQTKTIPSPAPLLKVGPFGIFYTMGRHIEFPPGFEILLVLIAEDTIHSCHDIIDNPCHKRILGNGCFDYLMDEGFILFTEGTDGKAC